MVVLQDYTITIYLNQYWTDERLTNGNLSASTSLTLTGDFADKIWVPDTFFANDKNSFLHDVTEKNKMIRLYGNGSVVYGMRQVSLFTFTNILEEGLLNIRMTWWINLIGLPPKRLPLFIVIWRVLRDLLWPWSGFNQLIEIESDDRDWGSILEDQSPFMV